MKATLIFNLPEEKEDHLDALRGSSLKWAIEEFDQWLRQLRKYQDKEVVDIDEARAKLHEMTEGLT